MINKRKTRDQLKLGVVILFSWLYIPHLLLYICKSGFRQYINADLDRLKEKTDLRMGYGMMLLYYLQTDRYFRTLFYHRIGPIVSILIGWWRPGDRYFVISKTTQIGEGAYFAHPFASEINAKSIGKIFHVDILLLMVKNRMEIMTIVR